MIATQAYQHLVLPPDYRFRATWFAGRLVLQRHTPCRGFPLRAYKWRWRDATEADLIHFLEAISP